MEIKMNGQKDRDTDGRTDRPAYRDARTYSKIIKIDVIFRFHV